MTCNYSGSLELDRSVLRRARPQPSQVTKWSLDVYKRVPLRRLHALSTCLHRVGVLGL